MNGFKSIVFIWCASSSNKRTVLALLSSLFWSAVPSIGLQLTAFQPSTAIAQEAPDLSTADAGWDQAWDSDATAESSASESSEVSTSSEVDDPGETGANNSASVQVPQEFITAWINDLKQSTDRWIEVDLSDQQLTAWEGDRQVYSATVSTGRADEPTLPGVFNIQVKQEKAWMQGDTYEIPNVPYTMYYSGNYAIHGTYWHNNFGTPVSNGCINLPVDQAAWLYDWASVGTTVVIEP